MEGNLFINIMPQIKAVKSENPTIAQQHFEGTLQTEDSMRQQKAGHVKRER